MHGLVQALQYLNLAAFTILAIAAVRLLRRRRGAAAFWATLAFSALAVVELLGRLAPAHPHGVGELALQRFLVAVLLLFPYLLYRFTTGFDPPARRPAAALRVMTVVMILWTFALPHFPEPGQAWSSLFVAYLAGFLVHWSVLSSISAVRLWIAGHDQPSVARRRMRLLACASAMLTVALFVVVSTTSQSSAAAVAAQLLAFLSAVAFVLGLNPPGLLRSVWRAPEQRRVQLGIESLMTLATTRAEVADRVLGPMADIVGARAVALRAGDGAFVGAHGTTPAELAELEQGRRPPGATELDAPGGTLLVWTTPYAPFFGEDELELLRVLGALTGLALDRVRLFEQEHEARVALERANDVMTNFVALAAHELRTPVTSIHGFVHTLNHLGDRLSAEQRDELSRTLEQQTGRMALLVEQLLDLSRLDAEAIDIAPQSLAVRARVSELVDAAVGAPGDGVAIDVPESLRAEVDPHAFDRIVTNLVTNAIRYGEAPIVVHAERNDRHFRLWVEDRGAGVPDEFVPDLFERFTRSGDAPGRERPNGTGLGLAIARSYARAHGGDLLYEHARPHGARFQFVLPGAAAAGPA